MARLHVSIARTVLLLVVLLLAACRSFEVQRQQIFLRYEPESDVLDAVLVSEGVGAHGSKDVDDTAKAVGSMGRGRRHFMVWDWPFEVDLDSAIASSKDKPLDRADPRAEFASQFLEYERNISVVDARFLLDDAHARRLCLLQRFRFEHAARVLHLIDVALNASLLQDSSRKEAVLTGDARTDERMLARARAGGSWARFDGKELEVTVPMSAEYAARQLGEYSKRLQASDRDWAVLAQIFDSLHSIRVTGEELVLRFAPEEDGWIHFTLHDDERSYDPALAERLARDSAIEAGRLEEAIRSVKARS